jgi:benzoyl-CoA reductase/2-hydroxyglutaryl-CoA dehydratase subunit BcrC/BadD/HgdB
VEQGHHLAAILKKIYILRSQGDLSASNTEFYRVIRQGEYLHPDDFIPLLEGFLGKSKGGDGKGPAVILSGILPNPSEILGLLDDLGVRVADDDLLNCGRRLLMETGRMEDPFEALTASYFAMPPCTTKASPLDERVNDLLKKIEVSRTKGVIFYMVKFCEPELFDVPQMVAAVKAAGVATLIIDVDLNQGLSGQLTTRVEAFVEMIS